MKFQCPNCGQKIEMESMYGGQIVQCPTCGTSLTTPVPDVSKTPPPEVIQTLQSSIDRGSMTISQFMAQKQIEGGVDLQTTEDKSTASSILTAEQGRKYKLGDVVAAGGMGAILDAKDVNLRRGVAMKVMLEPDKAGKEQIVRFIQEAQVTSQLEHPSIVPVHELGVDASGNVFYTMKFVKGRSLKDILEKIRKGDSQTIMDYPLSHLLTIFQKVCDAMAFAHSKRVIHRDLKPENVMVGDYGEVQVMDWGLAKVLPKKVSRRQYSESRMKKQPGLIPVGTSPVGIDSVRGDEVGEVLKTMDGSIMGTPGFMSPEQATGKTEEIDERTDIYALGAILYNILTLNMPVTGKSLAEIIEKVTKGYIRKPTEYNEQRIGDTSRVTHHVSLPHLPDNRIPESLSAVTMKALEVEAHRRYQTVKLLQKEIEAYQGGFATKAEDAGTWKQFALFVKRNKGVFVTLSAMMLVLFAAMGIYTRANVQARISAEKAGKLALESEQIAIKERKQAQANLDALRGLAPDLIDASELNIRDNNRDVKFDEAFRKISYAVDLMPSNAQYRCALGNILQLSHKFEEAERAYAEACRLDPTNKTARMNKELCREIIDEHKEFIDLPVGLVSRLFVLKRYEKQGHSIVPVLFAWFEDDVAQLKACVDIIAGPYMKEFVEKPREIPSKARSIGGHHYELYPVPTTWDDARKFCESIGAHLATLTSEQEQELLSKFNCDRFYIGFSADAGEKLRWISGEAFTNTIGWQTDRKACAGGFDKKSNYVLEKKNKKLRFLIEWDR